MENEQKYLNELKELILFSELYQTFYDKMKFSLSGVQEKAFDAVYYDTKKVFTEILIDRNLSLDSPAINRIYKNILSLNITLKIELRELKKLVDTPIKEISSEWFYLFTIISIRLKNVLIQKNKYQIDEKLLLQKFCENYYDKNHKARVKGGKNGAVNCSLQKAEAEKIYKEFANLYPGLIEMYKSDPSKNKPKTVLKKMLEKGTETSKLKDRTLQRWAKELLENDGVLNRKYANN